MSVTTFSSQFKNESQEHPLAKTAPELVYCSNAEYNLRRAVVAFAKSDTQVWSRLLNFKRHCVLDRYDILIRLLNDFADKTPSLKIANASKALETVTFRRYIAAHALEIIWKLCPGLSDRAPLDLLKILSSTPEWALIHKDATLYCKDKEIPKEFGHRWFEYIQGTRDRLLEDGELDDMILEYVCLRRQRTYSIATNADCCLLSVH